MLDLRPTTSIWPEQHERRACRSAHRLGAPIPDQGSDDAPAAHRAVCGCPWPGSSVTPQQSGGVTGELDPVQPDLLDQQVLGSDELPSKCLRVPDELQVVAGPGSNVGLELGHAIVQPGRVKVLGTSPAGMSSSMTALALPGATPAVEASCTLVTGCSNWARA